MASKRSKPEVIVSKLRPVQVLMGQGLSRLDAIRQIGVVEQTYYRRRIRNGRGSVEKTEPGRSFICLGTSGQLFATDRNYKPNPDRYVHAFAHMLPDSWYQMAAMQNGARPISRIGDQLGLSAAEVVALAETVSGDRVPIFLPYLAGDRSPLGGPQIRACFLDWKIRQHARTSVVPYRRLLLFALLMQRRVSATP